MQNNSSKQVLLSVIGVAILVVAVVGVSFAFFSYTRTGENVNEVRTGTIVFESSDTKMELTNVFPTTAASTDKVATVMVEGSTTYENGIDFVVTAGTVTNAGSAKNITPTVIVESETVDGITLTDVYDGTTALTSNTVLARGTIAANKTIAADTKILTIKAFYDMADYHISDNNKDELVAAGLLEDSYAGTIVSTTDWNALTTTDTPAYSFTINVTAVEGGSNRLPY